MRHLVALLGIAGESHGGAGLGAREQAREERVAVVAVEMVEVRRGRGGVGVLEAGGGVGGRGGEEEEEVEVQEEEGEEDEGEGGGREEGERREEGWGVEEGMSHGGFRRRCRCRCRCDEGGGGLSGGGRSRLGVGEEMGKGRGKKEFSKGDVDIISWSMERWGCPEDRLTEKSEPRVGCSAAEESGRGGRVCDRGRYTREGQKSVKPRARSHRRSCSRRDCETHVAGTKRSILCSR